MTLVLASKIELCLEGFGGTPLPKLPPPPASPRGHKYCLPFIFISLRTTVIKKVLKKKWGEGGKWAYKAVMGDVQMATR